jgi:hypothetical protein
MATVEIGSTLPTEVTSTGISFCETLATTTGTPEGGGGAAVCAVQLQTGEIKSTAIKLLEKFITAISTRKSAQLVK